MLAGMLKFALFLLPVIAVAQTTKPVVTLDEFFDSVDIHGVKISPDGHAVAIETARADWDGNRFRTDLWLYRDEGGGSLVQLTQSGHDHNAEWSPDGKWIAFLSDRGTADVDQVFAIALGGGEAFAVTKGDEKVHSFAWSADSKAIYYATRTPWSKEQQETYKKDWKDVVEFREAERGDAISRVGLPSGTPQPVASSPWKVKQLEVSPDGKTLAFLTDARSERWEVLEAYGIYAVDAGGGTPRQLLQRQAILDTLRWAPDSRHIFFSFLNGSVEESIRMRRRAFTGSMRSREK